MSTSTQQVVSSSLTNVSTDAALRGLVPASPSLPPSASSSPLPAPAPPPTPQPPVALASESLPASLALRQILATTDPRYASSFGTVVFKRTTRVGLKLIGWRPVDLAQRQWTKLERPLASLIVDRRHDWENERPRCQSGGFQSGSQIPAYILSCFLLGPDQAHATPHVAIISSISWFRRALGTIFMRSGLLVPDGFKCFGLPDRPEFYMAPGAARASPARSGTWPLANLIDFGVQMPWQYDSVNGIGVDVTFKGETSGRVTIGGVVHIAGESFGMTVRHAFTLPEGAPELEELDSDDCEIDIFEDRSLNDYDRLPGNCPDMSESLQTRPSAGASTQSALARDLLGDSHLVSSSHAWGGSEGGILAALEQGLDWALKKMRPSDENEYFTEPNYCANPDRVVLKTPLQLRYGELCSSGVLGIPTTVVPQPVLVLSASDVQPGECGSWAMSLRDGTVIGMLIGFTPTLGDAYLLPMADILTEIRQQTGHTATVTNRSERFSETFNPQRIRTATAATGSNLSLVMNRPNDVEFEEKPIPPLKTTREVLVAISYTSICGWDVHYWLHGAIGHYVVKDPMVLGHESAGVVVEVGPNVKTLKLGDRVALEPGYPCRRCGDCLGGRYNLCPEMAFAATPPCDGTLTGYWAAPADFCYLLPDNVSLQEGALIEPLAVAVHMVRQAQVAPGQSVVIMGAGPVGLLCAAAARAFGATKVVQVDIVQSKLDFALEYAATHAFIPQRVSPVENAGNIIASAKLGAGADVVIDASGTEPAIQASLHVVRAGGTYIQGGMGKSDITFPITALYLKEVTVRGSFRYGSGDFKLAIELVATGKVNVKSLVSGVVPFARAEDAFKMVREGQVIKVLIAGPNEKDIGTVDTRVDGLRLDTAPGDVKYGC